MPTAITGIQNFLTARLRDHNAPELIQRFLAHGGPTNMETQLNVSGGRGTRVPGTKSTYEYGSDRWWSYRVPKNADSTPEFRDYELTWSIDDHAEGIGSTGWDWANRMSRWVGFDFDAVVGHAVGVGITDEELKRVREAVQNLPYVEARRSTGGMGLHLYVQVEVPTNNHTEHAAVARCVLGIMSRDSGFDFSAGVDVCGGNMWIWHRKMTYENQGLALLKPATEKLDVPNWEDHVEVVSRKRAKVRIGVDPEDQDSFDALASAHRRVPLDDTHKAIMDALAQTGATVNWIADHHLLQTHTVAFDKLINQPTPCFECNGHGCSICDFSGDVINHLKIRGIYSTNSKGTDLAEANCFAFPGDDGSWRIYRFSPGISEAPTWEQDGRGWTTCWFNRLPTLRTAALGVGGRANKANFEFDTLEQALEAVRHTNPKATLDVEPELLDRKTLVGLDKSGRLTMQIEKKSGDDLSWNESRKTWSKTFDVIPDSQQSAVTLDYDNLIRCLETVGAEPAGWSIKKLDGTWTKKTSSSVKMVLQQLGHKKLEAEELMGYAEMRPWKLVMLPFQPEYPGNRQWNLGAPQLRFEPGDRDDSHPHWDKILNHLGKDLDKYLVNESWAAAVNVKTGADYLRLWYASILREPFEPLPYLFFWGDQDCGKSIFHEAFQLLVTTGVVLADRALTNQSDFNGELVNAILCVVEEKDISRAPGAYEKIKAAVTNRHLSIRRMRTDSYMVPNTTHWVQNANKAEFCPIFPGDTRTTMIHVGTLEEVIPKSLLIQKLIEEAPAFLRTLLDMEFPAYLGRLRIPVIETEHKLRQAEMSRSLLDVFFDEQTEEAIGEQILFSEFFQKFVEWLPPGERGQWSRIRVSHGVPMRHATKTGSGNRTYLTNILWRIQ